MAIQVRLHSCTVAIIITPLSRIDAASTQCSPELFVLRIIKRKPKQKCLDFLRARFAHSLHRTIAVLVDGLFIVAVWTLLSFRLHRHDHCLSFVSTSIVKFSYLKYILYTVVIASDPPFKSNDIVSKSQVAEKCLIAPQIHRKPDSFVLSGVCYINTTGR